MEERGADMSFNEKELHEIYDQIEGGICLFSNDDEKRIVFASSGLLTLYHCETQEEFFSLTHGHFKGMVYDADYQQVMDRFGLEGTHYLTFRRIALDSTIHHVVGYSRLITLDGQQYSYMHLMYGQVESAYHQLTQSLPVLDATHFYNEVLNSISNQENDYVPIVFNVTNFKEYNRFYGISAGDDCIEKIAETLIDTFQGDLVGHAYADNFLVCAHKKQLHEKIQRVCETINHYIGNSSILIKCGLFNFIPHSSLNSVRHVFDRAKLACSSISHDATKDCAYYTEEMSKMQDHRLYIIRNFEQAMEKGHIKVFLQPVVRTYSEKLCGFEALARWDDPQLGLISPGLFVPILEDAKLISKLDHYIIEKVCQHFTDHAHSDAAQVPISVNLSRIDFDLLDPFQDIEALIEKYRVDRSLLRIEITETVLQRNEAKLATMIGQFHNAGYQVWLDDFGSEYSSLNALHNYHFDELKIDMGFFRHFDEKSRKIITSVVMMAKVLEMHTLAEGVETREQADFLREIGCGKIQGYYYGKPMPYGEVLAHCQKRGITIEKVTDAKMYDQAELINIISNNGTAILHYDGVVPQMLAWNATYKKVMETAGTIGRIKANENLRAKDYPLRGKFKKLLDQAYQSKNEEVISYVDNGQYYRVAVKYVAGLKDDWLGIAQLSNMTGETEYSKMDQYDMILRHLYQIYDGIYYLNRSLDQIEVLECVHERINAGTIFHHIDQTFETFTHTLVHPDDREMYLHFINIHALYQSLKKNDQGVISTVVRVKREDGIYHWTEYIALLLYKTKTKDIVICERKSDYDSHKDDPHIVNLMKNMQSNL